MAETSKLKVYLDGSCAFCQAVKAKVEPRDKQNRLEFVDYNDPAVAATAPFPREVLDTEMHVRNPDGAWAVGFAGWAAILRVLPGWGWLGRLFDVSPFRQLGPGFYRWIARHRYRIPGFPAMCTPEKCEVPPGRGPQSPKATAAGSGMMRPESR